MSFDDYAEHIYRKYRLCIAIAVLKAKPPDMSSTEYITWLQSKMADNMDEDDVTVCSEDFVMEDDDSVTILKDFDDEQIGDLANNEIFGILSNRSQASSGSLKHLPDHLTKTIPYNNMQTEIEPSIDNDVTCCENDFTVNKDNSKRTEKLNNSSNLNDKEFDDISNNLASNNAFFNNDSNIKHSNNNELNPLTDSNLDTQKTILYTVYGFTQNPTHYSASQNDIVIPNKYLYATNNEKKIITVENNTKSSNIADAISSDVTNFSSVANIKNTDITKSQYSSEVSPVENTSENTLDNQNTIPFSQNMDEVFEVHKNEKHLKNNNHENRKTRLADNNLDYSQNVNDYFNEIHNLDSGSRFHDISDEDTIKNKNLKDTFELTQNHTIFSQENLNEASLDSKTTHLDTNQSNIIDKHNQKVIPEHNTENTSQYFGRNSCPSQKNTQEIPPFEIIEEEFNTVEVIPYKVLEELNKVKMFLRRRDRRLSGDGYSTDSGYRSDSQLRSSNRSALQLSGISINQSAYCLFNHIMQCPLVSATREIISEIAQTLGQLIDRLHEEESYPPFLEELLDTVDILLRQVYKGQSCEEHEFLKKDDFFQRILLLNKSIHIQSHSIEKITSILTIFHEKITDRNITYELTNIDEIENLPYLFHILEILINKYIKNKDNLSQSSQLSQDEDKILNKSSITDIWRKKWNPNFKENPVGSRENRCVLKMCSEILNKVIVDCVNSYSLLAFSALKCFNSMQS